MPTKGQKRWIGAVLAAGVVVCGVALAWRESQTYRVSISPGQRVILTIRTPMQRLWEHKSYSQQPGLPVGCRLSSVYPSPGVTIQVVDTGHRLSDMWAKLLIATDPDAPRGTHHHTADFTINQQGNWPQVHVVVRVH